MKKHLLTLGMILFAATSVFAVPELIGTVEYQASRVSDFDFEMSWEDLYIEESNSSDTVYVEVYCNKKKYAPKVKLSHSSLEISSAHTSSFLTVEQKRCTVKVYIPAGKKLEKAAIELSSGDMKNIEALTADEIVLELSSGNINAGRLDGRVVKAVASSGNIKIDEIIAKKAVVQASSGNITVGAVQAQEYYSKTSSGNQKTDYLNTTTAEFSATSGDIKLRDITAQEISLSASSGKLTAEGLLADKLVASTSSGTIGFELNAAPKNKSVISTTSGTLFVSMPQNSAATIVASTSTGRFVNSFTREKIESHADYRQDINGGGAILSLSSTSGNITVDADESYLITSDIPVVNIDRPIF